MTADTLLEARGLGRRLPSGFVWRGLDVDVRPGDRLAIVGPSGAGKSLLLRALALLDPVDEGEVRFRGERRRPPDHRARALLLPQRAAALGATVEADLRRAFALRIHRHRRFDPAVAAATAARLGRSDGFLGASTGTLSGGEAQSLALLRALLLEPEVLLLDEATSALDAATAAAVEAELRRWLAAGPRALVFVAHDPALVARLATGRLDLGAPA